jgi:Cytochrome P460
VLWPSLARLFLFMTTSQLDMKEVLMNRLLLVFVAMLLLVVTSTIAGPEKIVFPSSYKSHVRYATVDRPDNKTVREVYISPESAKAVNPGEPLPHGTVITMEVYRARVDEKGDPVKDAAGRFIKGDLTGIFVMAKQADWGADYPDDLRNGEWEYARFTPEGQPHANADTTPCFQCHKPLSGQDFVFTQPQLLTAPK